jgi:hypothetical protein
MAVFRGVSGQVMTGAAPGTKIANIKNWSMTVDVGNNDTSSFGDTNTTSVMGLRNATAQVSGDLSTDASQGSFMAMAANNGTLQSVRLRLVMSTGSPQNWGFIAQAANLTNLQIGSEVAGVASFSASFHLSGGAKYPTS